MNKHDIIIQGSGWLMGLALVMGLAYAILLYSKRTPWSSTTNVLLAISRFIVVTVLLALFFLDPLVRRMINRVEAPLVVLAVDNSASVSMADTNAPAQLYKALAQIKQKLNANGIELETVWQADTATDTIVFNKPITNLGELVALARSQHENHNLAAIVLATDGIVNRGAPLKSLTTTLPLHVLALGDTTRYSDLAIQSVVHNQIGYLGNKIPIRVQLYARNYANKTTQLTITAPDGTVQSEVISIKNNQALKQYDFLIEPKKTGRQAVTIEVTPVENEKNIRNNKKTVFLEILKGKQKVLVYAAAPHPDIQALKLAAGQKQNFELTVKIAALGQKPDKTPYDLVILHQIPNRLGLGNELSDQFLSSSTTPIWYMAGSNSQWQSPHIKKLLSLNPSGGRTDEVLPGYNPEFTTFTYPEDLLTRYGSLPPLTVPYGNYAPTGTGMPMFFQKVGAVKTNKPLMVFNATDSKKTALLAGEGLWRWRMAEYAEFEDTKAVDLLINKTIQYLSARRDKRRFRFYPEQPVFDQSMPVRFVTEVYNPAYEKIFNQKINLTLKPDSGKSVKFSFVNSKSGYVSVGRLPAGQYHYTATTNSLGDSALEQGAFFVQQQQLEALDLTAKHNQLRALSQQNNGSFATADSATIIANAIIKTKPPSAIRTTQRTDPLLNRIWILIALLSLLTTEWFFRKFLGSY